MYPHPALVQPEPLITALHPQFLASIPLAASAAAMEKRGSTVRQPHLAAARQTAPLTLFFSLFFLLSGHRVHMICCCRPGCNPTHPP